MRKSCILFHCQKHRRPRAHLYAICFPLHQVKFAGGGDFGDNGFVGRVMRLHGKGVVGGLGNLQAEIGVVGGNGGADLDGLGVGAIEHGVGGGAVHAERTVTAREAVTQAGGPVRVEVGDGDGEGDGEVVGGDFCGEAALAAIDGEDCVLVEYTTLGEGEGVALRATGKTAGVLEGFDPGDASIRCA